MLSHNTLPQEKEKPLSDILLIYQASFEVLSELLAKDKLTLVESRCFVRTFADLGECLTFFREGNPHLADLKSLTFINAGGQQQELLSGFTGFRNKLLHDYVYEHLLDYEVKFEAALRFAQSNLERFNTTFREVIQKIQSTSVQAASTAKVETSTSNASKEEALPSSVSTAISSSSLATKDPILTKKINKANVKPSPYNILDQAYFAKQEVLELEKMLHESGLDTRVKMRPEILEKAVAENSYLKTALENKIENFCTIMNAYNQIYNDKRALPNHVKSHLYNQYENKLSLEADTFLLGAARKRISIAHRENLEQESPLSDKINYVREIKNVYLEKTILHLYQKCKLVYNDWIAQYETKKLKSSMEDTAGAAAAYSAASFTDPGISASSSSSTSEKSTPSKRGSLVGVQSLQELVSTQVKKAKSIADSSGYVNTNSETASASPSALPQESSVSEPTASSPSSTLPIEAAAASKLRKIPDTSEIEKRSEVQGNQVAKKSSDDEPPNPSGLRR